MTTESQRIIYTSPPAGVSMTDAWYDIASLNHFWIQRRFNVFQQLAEPLVRGSRNIAEVGCGNGLQQRLIEDYYHTDVAGFDLNELALKQNVSTTSQLYCYDIHDRAPEFLHRFDLIILFDVLEHIEEEAPFLKALLFHLAPGGTVIVNVPANHRLFSDYDRVAGHFRRYSIGSLREAASESGLTVPLYTYWGAPLMPFLILRKAWLKFHSGEEDIVSAGFDPGPRFVNRWMGRIARCEQLPQRRMGTSLMAILKRTSWDENDGLIETSPPRSRIG
jgi:SAM-dependent methyltransferase